MADERLDRRRPKGRELAFAGGWLVGAGCGLAAFVVLFRLGVPRMTGLVPVLAAALALIVAGAVVGRSRRNPGEPQP